MPAVMTPGGPLDLSSVLFRNRIIFIGQPVNSQVAQRVISQLLTLAAIDEDADILVWFYFKLSLKFMLLKIILKNNLRVNLSTHSLLAVKGTFGNSEDSSKDLVFDVQG